MQLLNVSLTILDDADLLSQPDGTAKKYYSNRQTWALSMNMHAVNCAMSVKNLASGGGVAVWWEFSWDGQTWFRSQNPVVAEQTSNGDYHGEFSTSSEIAPLGRLAVDVRQPVTPTSQKWATVSLFAHYKMAK